MRKINASEIILDFDFYPRNNLDSKNLSNIMDAREAGIEMPPVIIDKKSKRCVDGFHRIRAEIRLFKDKAEVNAIEKTYKTEGEMFLDAIRYNAAHGARLDPCDRVHCAIIAERLSLPIEAVAGAMNMPVEKLGALHNTRTASTLGGLSVPLKRTNQHMAGKRLSKRQEEANARSSGMSQVFYVNQLVDLIEAKLLDMEDEQLLLRLRHLHGLLDGLLVTAG